MRQIQQVCNCNLRYNVFKSRVLLSYIEKSTIYYDLKGFVFAENQRKLYINGKAVVIPKKIKKIFLLEMSIKLLQIESN